jgi:hypothetical protein
VTQIAVERGIVTDQQAAQILAIWGEIHPTPRGVSISQAEQ